MESAKSRQSNQSRGRGTEEGGRLPGVDGVELYIRTGSSENAPRPEPNFGRRIPVSAYKLQASTRRHGGREYETKICARAVA